MPVRPVLRLPDRTLSCRASEIGEIDDVARAVAVDLVDTMRCSPACVGLAAPQIGRSLRAFVLDVSKHKRATACHGLVVLFDPIVVEASDMETRREGCMSVPDLTGNVARATRIVVTGTCPDGSAAAIETEGFEARAFLHEIDHLDGKVFLDRVAGPHAVFRRKVYRQPARPVAGPGPRSDPD